MMSTCKKIQKNPQYITNKHKAKGHISDTKNSFSNSIICFQFKVSDTEIVKNFF